MKYVVVLTPRAKRNLKTIHAYIFEQAPNAADDWLNRAERAVNSLGQHPERCPLAPESRSFGKPIRQLLFGAGNRGTYRALFLVADQMVYIMHVRHGARLSLYPDE